MTIQQAKENYRKTFLDYRMACYEGATKQLNDLWDKYKQADIELDRAISIHVHEIASATAEKVLTEKKHENQSY